MHLFSTLLIGLGLPLLALAQENTIYVSSSCKRKPVWDTAYAESSKMIQRAVQRLRSTTPDPDYEAVVYELFKVRRTDTQDWNRLIQVMDELHRQTLTNNQRQARIRMYCDNDGDKRWKYDHYTADDGEKWSFDPFNEMWSIGLPGCHSDPKALGITYNIPHVPDPGQTSAHRADRKTITICDHTFNQRTTIFLLRPDETNVQQFQRPSRLPANMAEIPPTANADYFSLLVSLTITHERVHGAFDDITDNVSAQKEGGWYEWREIATLDKATALKNADNYAYLALYALLADNNWHLRRMDAYPPGSTQQQIDAYQKKAREERKQGRVVKYEPPVVSPIVKGRLARMIQT